MLFMCIIVWIESLSQSTFLDQSFGIQPAEYPQLIVLSAKKKQFAPLVGAFTVEGIKEFLASVLRGATRTQPIFTKELVPLAGDTKKCVAPPKPPAADKTKKPSKVHHVMINH